MRARRDGGLVLLVVVWVAVVLGLDVGASLDRQRLLGVGTAVLLLAVLRGESRATRVQVGVVVAYAAVIELIFAGWLKVYAYRLDGVPWFVFPGHGLVYLAALAFGRLPWAHRHSRVLVAGTAVTVAAWGLWGVTLADRPDALGAFWAVCLLVFLRWGSSPLLYVGAFVVVSYLEIVGTSLNTWTWGPADPITGWITIGNPPSGIAGGYAWFDAAALWLAPALLRRLGQTGTVSGSAAATASGDSLASTTTASSTSAPPAT